MTKKYIKSLGVKRILTTTITILIGVFFLYLCSLFLYPIRVGILNEGTVLGFGFCFSCSIFFFGFHYFVELYKTIWSHSIGRVVLIILTLLLVLFIALAFVLSILMYNASVSKPISPQNVVVLGCKVNGEQPSKMLKFRLDAAYDYLVENPDVKCIVTGGQGHNEIVAEATVMKRYLTERGITADRIFVDDTSTNTRENLSNASDILEENGLDNSVMIVTDGYHQFRSGMIAKRIGLVPYGLSAKTEGYLIPVYWVREWVGIIHHLIFS